MREKPNYFKAAAAHPIHKALLVAGGVAAFAGLWRGTFWPLALFVVVEIAYLLVTPALPGFRRGCDEEAAHEEARQRALELERIASRLSPNAKSRLDGLARTRGKILDSMRTLSTSKALEQEWAPRLDALMNSALRILVSVDATRADSRDQRFLESEVRDLEEEVGQLPDGPAKAAKAQRLELARKRQGGFARVAEGREAAIAQLETIEDLMRELLAKGLSERDAAAFATRIDALSAQIDAAGESIAALDRHAEDEAEIAALKGRG